MKAVEGLRRGSEPKLIVGGENSKKPKEWKSFLTNVENKKQLIEVLLAVWSSDSFKENIKDRVVVLVCEGEACKISFEEEQSTCRKIASLTLFQPGGGVESTPSPGFSLAIATKINRSTLNFLTFNFYYRDIIRPKIKFITCQGVT